MSETSARLSTRDTNMKTNFDLAPSTNPSSSQINEVNGLSVETTSLKLNWKDQPHVGKYKLIRTLGRGNFAKVKLAQHVTTGKEVAVKVIDKGQLNQASMSKLSREVKVMKQLNHPNIVKLYEVIESERHVYLIMEFASNGELFEFLVSHGRIKEKEAREKFRQIVSAVQYCHQKNIVHRDLKAENLLLDADNNIKLADFGFSNNFLMSKKLNTFCGSPPYAAPELFQGRKYTGPEVDVWSLGVILYTIVSGYLPFDAQNLPELRERVLRGKYRIPFYMSTDCEMLLKRMLVINPERRLTLLSVMQHKWMNIGYDGDPLTPYLEPPPCIDPLRMENMVEMGFNREEVMEALEKNQFNNITATYLLLNDHKLPTLKPENNYICNKKNICESLAEDEFESPDTPTVLISSTSHSNKEIKKHTLALAWPKQEKNSQETTSSCSTSIKCITPEEVSKNSVKFGLKSAGSEKKSRKRTHFGQHIVQVPTETTRADDEMLSSNIVATDSSSSGVRRTHTFASAPSQRHSTVAGHHPIQESENMALVRAPSMANILRDIPPTELHLETGLNTEVSGVDVTIFKEDSLLPLVGKQESLSHDPECQTPVNSSITHAATLKKRDSFWKRLGRSFSKRKKISIVCEPTDINSPIPTPFLGVSDRSNTPTKTTRHARSRQKSEDTPEILHNPILSSDSSKPPHLLQHTSPDMSLLKCSARYRPEGANLVGTCRLTDDVSNEPPQKILQSAAPYRSGTSFVRNLTSRISRSFRRKRKYTGQEQNVLPTQTTHLSSSEKIASHPPEIDQFALLGDASEKFDECDPWSPMLHSSKNCLVEPSNTRTSYSKHSCLAHPHNSLRSLEGISLLSEVAPVDLGTILPTRWGQKPRKVSLLRHSQIRGGDPALLVSKIINVLVSNNVIFTRLGEYFLQLVFTQFPKQQKTRLSSMIEEHKSKKSLIKGQVRISVEICQYLGTKSFAVIFKLLSGESRLFRILLDCLVRIIKSKDVSPSQSISVILPEK